MAGILRNFQPALKNGFLKIKKTCILWAQCSENVSNVKIGQNDFDVFSEQSWKIALDLGYFVIKIFFG